MASRASRRGHNELRIGDEKHIKNNLQHENNNKGRSGKDDSNQGTINYCAGDRGSGGGNNRGSTYTGGGAYDGQMVKVDGLLNDTHYNGMPGVIFQANPGKATCVVILSSGEKLLCRKSNLQPLGPEMMPSRLSSSQFTATTLKDRDADIHDAYSTVESASDPAGAMPVISGSSQLLPLTTSEPSKRSGEGKRHHEPCMPRKQQAPLIMRFLQRLVPDSYPASSLNIHHVSKNVLTLGLGSISMKTSAKKVRDWLANTYGDGKFVVWNLCKVGYEPQLLDNKVVHLPSPAFPSLPAHRMLGLCKSVHSWLSLDPLHVAVLQCRTGRGRSAAAAACYLHFADPGRFQMVEDALHHVARSRDLTLRKLTNPTQIRFCRYFAKHLIITREMLAISSNSAQSSTTTTSIANVVPATVIATTAVATNALTFNNACVPTTLTKTAKATTTKGGHSNATAHSPPPPPPPPPPSAPPSQHTDACEKASKVGYEAGVVAGEPDEHRGKPEDKHRGKSEDKHIETDEVRESKSGPGKDNNKDETDHSDRKGTDIDRTKSSSAGGVSEADDKVATNGGVEKGAKIKGGVDKKLRATFENRNEEVHPDTSAPHRTVLGSNPEYCLERVIINEAPDVENGSVRPYIQVLSEHKLVFDGRAAALRSPIIAAGSSGKVDIGIAVSGPFLLRLCHLPKSQVAQQKENPKSFSKSTNSKPCGLCLLRIGIDTRFEKAGVLRAGIEDVDIAFGGLRRLSSHFFLDLVLSNDAQRNFSFLERQNETLMSASGDAKKLPIIAGNQVEAIQHADGGEDGNGGAGVDSAIGKVEGSESNWEDNGSKGRSQDLVVSDLLRQIDDALGEDIENPTLGDLASENELNRLIHGTDFDEEDEALLKELIAEQNPQLL